MLLLKRSLLSRRRCYRQGLVYFFEMLTLYLEAGYDLGYAWNESVDGIGNVLDEDLKNLLVAARKEDGIVASLGYLTKAYPFPSERLWFGVVQDLYGKGASLKNVFVTLVDVLSREHENDLAEHMRNLPQKSNLILIAFFLPAAFLLLFAPLLWQLSQGLVSP